MGKTISFDTIAMIAGTIGGAFTGFLAGQVIFVYLIVLPVAFVLLFLALQIWAMIQMGDSLMTWQRSEG